MGCYYRDTQEMDSQLTETAMYVQTVLRVAKDRSRKLRTRYRGKREGTYLNTPT